MVKNQHPDSARPPHGAVVINPVQGLLEQIYQQVTPFTHGEVATYIPQLARANPDWFGVTIVTTSNLCIDLCPKLRKANRELAVFG